MTTNELIEAAREAADLVYCETYRRSDGNNRRWICNCDRCCKAMLLKRLIREADQSAALKAAEQPAPGGTVLEWERLYDDHYQADWRDLRLHVSKDSDDTWNYHVTGIGRTRPADTLEAAKLAAESAARELLKPGHRAYLALMGDEP